jgi:hypothetical protein
MRRTVLLLTALTIAGQIEAAPVHYAADSRTSTAPYYYASWTLVPPLPGVNETVYLPNAVDFTLDHVTGAFTLNDWTFFGPDGATIYALEPLAMTLTPSSAHVWAGSAGVGYFYFDDFNGWTVHFDPSEPLPQLDGVALDPRYPLLEQLNANKWRLNHASVGVPEPAAWLMTLAGIAVIARWRRTV